MLCSELESATPTYFSDLELAAWLLKIVDQQQQERPLWVKHDSSKFNLAGLIGEEFIELQEAWNHYKQSTAEVSAVEAVLPDKLAVAGELADIIYFSFKILKLLGNQLPKISAKVFDPARLKMTVYDCGFPPALLPAQVEYSDQLLKQIEKQINNLQSWDQLSDNELLGLIKSLLQHCFDLTQELGISAQRAVLYKVVRNGLKYDKNYLQKGDYNSLSLEAKLVWRMLGDNEFFRKFWLAEGEEILLRFNPEQILDNDEFWQQLKQSLRQFLFENHPLLANCAAELNGSGVCLVTADVGVEKIVLPRVIADQVGSNGSNLLPSLDGSADGSRSNMEQVFKAASGLSRLLASSVNGERLTEQIVENAVGRVVDFIAPEHGNIEIVVLPTSQLQLQPVIG